MDTKDPYKFNEDREEDILDAARNGASIRGCARAGRIDKRTLGRWLDAGKEETEAGRESVLATFYEKFRAARSEGEQELLKATAQKDPRFILATSFDYVKKSEVALEHSGNLMDGVSETELEQAREKLGDLLEQKRQQEDGQAPAEEPTET